MNQNRINVIVEALTRSTPSRDKLLGHGQLSDEILIMQITGTEINPKRLRLLVSVSRLLRLMDSLLVNRETGEGFVSKFSEQWLQLQDWREDSILEEEFDNLNNFYSDIQMFSASDRNREEEPLLFGLDQLKYLTRKAYELLKKKLCLSLLDRSNK